MEHGFDFQRLAIFEINEGGGAISAHCAGAFDHSCRQLGIEIEGFGVGDDDDFIHQSAHPIFPFGMRQELVGGPRGAESSGQRFTFERGQADGGGYAKPVERNVPNEFFPEALFEIIGYGTGHTGFLKQRGESVRAFLGRAGVFAHDDFAEGKVLDDAGCSAVQAHEAQSAEDFFHAKKFSKFLAIAEAILQAENRGMFTDERRDEFGVVFIGSGLERYEHEIARADGFGRIVRIRIHGEIAIGTIDAESAGVYRLVIAAQQKVYVLACATEFAAIKAAYRTRADDTDFHRL